jgi:vancomycin resistance protein VanW
MPTTLRDAGAVTLAMRRVRRAVVGGRRLARWAVEGWPEPALGAGTGAVLWRRVVPIAREGIDARLEDGKRRNVALAAPAFDGVEISAARPLSFWRALGPATAARGFGNGIEIAGGCVVPAIGGGLCLVSNALFAMAAELGWTILERHGHSIALADPRALDATVAFPHIDLRIAPRHGRVQLAVAIEGDALVITARGERDPAIAVTLEHAHTRGDGWIDVWVRRRISRGATLIEDAMLVRDRKQVPAALRTCLDCGEVACRARRPA